MAAPSSHPRDRLKRELSLFDTTLLVVSSVVGSGIFLTPGTIAERLPDPGWILLAWIAGGLLSLAGALANAELGAMFPRAGGDYVYLREAFHPLAGFLVGWLTFFAIYAGTIATLAAGFAMGLASFVPLSEGGQLALAIGLTLGISALNYVGVRWGARANNAATAAKLLALLLFGVLGLALAVLGGGSPAPAPAPAPAAVTPVAFGLALSPVLFSYLGWNASVYVASEIRDPSRNIPRSLFLGLAACTGLYLLLNGVYLAALPMDALRGEPNAARAAADALVGEAGGALVGLLVLLSILGTLNATVLVGPRIAYAMALDGLFFRGVDQTHAHYRTPTVAIAVQAATAVGLLLMLNTFERALSYTTFAILLASLADVAALIRLRSRRPELARPYRAWGYPWLPGLYALAIAAVGISLLVGQPVESLVGVGLALLGIPFYGLFRRSGASSHAQSP